MENSSVSPKDILFVLDIGTRSIIGLAGYRQDDIFHVLACEMVQHPKRAMIDGQIEDIQQVAHVAGALKTRLEESLGHPLKQVSIAAAGRALKTLRCTHEQPLTGPATSQTVYALENGAINQARQQLANESDTQYYCVGHSAVRYWVDDYPYSTIVDHAGKTAKAEVIATFLPTEVVSSLRRCMELLDLEIDTLTLEPIAAMRAVIPQDIRLLNLALVDVGAGTSDIAISREGSVAGYTMATVAGDEITEAIIKKYLVNFKTAEKIKAATCGTEDISFTDILGFQHTINPAEVLTAIDPALEMLAKVISDKILELNEGPPNAVFLVGGGSKIQGLCPKLAQRLGLDENKVALAGHSFSGTILNENSGADGPEFATPVGIALVAADDAAKESTRVSVNGRNVRLYTPEASRVMDVLLIAGYRYTDLMGRSGESLTFTLNGISKTLRGGHYTSAEILVNGKPASLVTTVTNGSEIQITPATPGQNATAVIGDFMKDTPSFTVLLDGRPLAAGAVARKNKMEANPHTAINNLDDVEIYLIQTLADLQKAYDLSSHTYFLQNEPLALDYPLKQGDAIFTKAVNSSDEKNAGVNATAKPVPLEKPTAQNDKIIENKTAMNIAKAEPASSAEAAEKNEAAVSAMQPPTAATAKNAIVEEIPFRNGSVKITLNEKVVVLPPKADNQNYFLFDLLPLVDIDPAKPQGRLLLEIDKTEAAYSSVVSNGCSVFIRWGEA